MGLIMFYYKIEENGEVVSVEARSTVSADETMIEIDETEYSTIKNELLGLNMINEESINTETNFEEQTEII